MRITLNDIDLSNAVGELVAIDGMLEEFISLPKIKQPYTNDWGDTDSLEVDVSTPLMLHQREVNFKVFARSNTAKERLLESINANPGYVRVHINEFNNSIRLLEYEINEIDTSRYVISIKASIDYQERFIIDGDNILDIDDFEDVAKILNMTFLETKESNSIVIKLKPYVEIDAKNTDGINIMPKEKYNTSHQSKTIELYYKAGSNNDFRNTFQRLQYYLIYKGRFMLNGRHYIYSNSNTKQLIEKNGNIYWSFEITIMPA